MNGELSSPQDVFSWTESFTNLERNALPFDKRNYRLDRMRRLLEMFDHPDSAFRIIHVAGTKGKGSTSALIASVLGASGARTGLYTSPHVQSAFERISIVGEQPRSELMARIGRQVKRRIDGLPAEGMPGGIAPTTFELYTLLAFLYFREAGCTDAVIEVGIGGRLDATNVVTPEASVITPLDLEHTDVLGDTIEKIAFEKAGIVKPRAPAFVGLQGPAAKGVFRQVAAERDAPIVFLDEESLELSSAVDASGTSLRLHLRGDEPMSFRLAMVGDFQAENAALAALTLRRTRPELPLSAYHEGFGHTTLPGRMEVRPGSPVIVLDGAHTPLAVTRLLASFRRVFPGDAVLVFGSVSGKRPQEMAQILGPAFSTVIVSTPGTFKESNPSEVADIFRRFAPSTILERNPRAALARAREASGGTRPILITGSFYMVSEIRRLL